MIWPLKLTVMEQLLLAEDRPSYPCVVFLRLRFSGLLNETAARTAMLVVLPRHPLLISVIRKQSWGQAEWVAAENQVPQFESFEGTTGDDFPICSFLDLTKEIGLRVRFVTSDKKTEVVLQLHHAVCDGLGALGFIHDWLIAYALEIGVTSAAIAFPKIDEHRLRLRGKFGLTFWKFLRMSRKQIIGLRGVRDFLRNKPTPLIPFAARAQSETVPARFPAILTHNLSSDDTTRLAQASKHQGVTINDLLIQSLLLGIGKWQRQNGVYDPNRCLRIMIPMSLRSQEDCRTPATNIISSIFLDRCGADSDDPKRLLQSIHDQMQIIKQNGLGLTFIFSLLCRNRLPGGIAKAVRSEQCTISSILTNLGPILRHSPLPQDGEGRLLLGDLALEHFEWAAPLRPYLCASFAVATYANRLGIGMHYDLSAMSESQARDLLASIVRQLV